MIRIHKGDAPDVLARQGVPLVDQYCRDYDDAPAPYDAGVAKFAIERPVYAHRSVFDALVAVHHGKCAYCEWKITRAFADADVEHWRPKGGVKQARGSRVIYPGYYWLAYQWDNLLLSCRFCNRSNKGVLFPLTDPAARVLNHRTAVAGETPRILKPDGVEDPRDHIYFVEDIPYPRTQLGEATIDVLGLAKREHVPRRDHFLALQDAHELVSRHGGRPDGLARSVDKYRAFLEGAVAPSAPFSAMAIDFLQAAAPLPPKQA